MKIYHPETEIHGDLLVRSELSRLVGFVSMLPVGFVVHDAWLRRLVDYLNAASLSMGGGKVYAVQDGVIVEVELSKSE
jgi:hypothetical protein